MITDSLDLPQDKILKDDHVPPLIKSRDIITGRGTIGSPTASTRASAPSKPSPSTLLMLATSTSSPLSAETALLFIDALKEGSSLFCKHMLMKIKMSPFIL